MRSFAMRPWTLPRCLVLTRRPLRSLPSLPLPSYPPPPPGTRRCRSSTAATLEAPYTEHVQVKCASAGHITVSLHGIHDLPKTSPLIINLPAFPVQDTTDVESYLPLSLYHHPSATIHYRWPTNRGEPPPSALPDSAPNKTPDLHPNHWPTPLTDTLAGYDFLARDLSPAPPSTPEDPEDVPAPASAPVQRPAYIHGSYLGATLGASLALTESRIYDNEAPMAVRGLVAYNGIYNWTTFLPDHRLSRSARDDDELALMRALMPRLFGTPGNLFDPFASPVLFFHGSGLLVPSGFDKRWRPEWKDNLDDIEDDFVYSDPDDPPPPALFPEAETEVDSDDAGDKPAETSPRKGFLSFPPRGSMLRLPETLLLYSTPPPVSIDASIVGRWSRIAAWKKLKNEENSFASQALALAQLMERRLTKNNATNAFASSPLQNDDSDDWMHGTAWRRIKTRQVGKEGGRDRTKTAQLRNRMILQWLQERIDR